MSLWTSLNRIESLDNNDSLLVSYHFGNFSVDRPSA